MMSDIFAEMKKKTFPKIARGHIHTHNTPILMVIEFIEWNFNYCKLVGVTFL